MLISIVTVALNAAEDLPLTIESVLAQDHPRVEYVVIDGNSLDETRAVLDRYRGAIDEVHEIDDGGVFYAMNASLDMVSGDMVLFMNAGDRLFQADTLRRLVERWDGAADIVYGNHVYRDGGTDAFRRASDFSDVAARLRAGQLKTTLPLFPAHQATLAKATLLRSLRFDTSFRICADHDLVLRAYDQGARLQYVDEIVAVYRSGGLSHRMDALAKVEWNALYRQFAANPERVDANYGDPSPFDGTPSRASGAVVTGTLPEAEGAAGPSLADGAMRWIAAGGFGLRTPGHTGTEAMSLRGYNPVDGQTLDLQCGSTTLHTVEIARGPFCETITFDPALAPGTLLDGCTSGLTRVEGILTPVALALGDVSFETTERAPARTWTRGATIRFGRDHAAEAEEVLGEGWSVFEEEFIWSIGERSHLAIASFDAPERLEIKVMANPLPEEPRLTVTLNNAASSDHALPARVMTTIAVPVAGAWRSDGTANHVAFTPSHVGAVGHDPRRLGVALYAITLA